jgi:hypothetical protein
MSAARGVRRQARAFCKMTARCPFIRCNVISSCRSNAVARRVLRSSCSRMRICVFWRLNALAHLNDEPVGLGKFSISIADPGEATASPVGDVAAEAINQQLIVGL